MEPYDDYDGADYGSTDEDERPDGYALFVGICVVVVVVLIVGVVWILRN